ncbi:hypothetical protein CASFOL_031393 [Castilleja foliolosa]|uniref:Uncharacterized protein n=1 Tax=Castilleja foliolosa TaxID=1961234 RepID=A0ABD3C4K7_9LAMI
MWDFFHIDFDRNIRVDLIAQLIASYDPKKRASKVENYRIMVSRADFARAFKLNKPRSKRSNNNAGGVVDVDLECEALSDDSIEFVRVLVDDWVLLHPEDDTWMMPNEVAVLYKVIKDGHPEKVDWGSLFWLMVEKELKKGGQLGDCYYASHLQHLIKFQRADLFSNVKKEICEDGVCLMEGSSTELTLGQDSEKEEGKGGRIIIKGVEICKETEYNDEVEHETEEQEEEKEEQEQEQWLLNEQNKIGEYFIQRCSSGNKFHVFSSDDPLEGAADVFTGNLLQAMEPNQMSFDHHHHHLQDDQLCNQSSVDIGSIPSFLNNTGKRVIKHDFNDSNKKLRNLTERAKMLYEEKEQALQHSNVNQQILLSELQKRDEVIEHLHKTRVEEIEKKDGELYRLEHELCLMESVLEDYRKALKETSRVFSEYREKARFEEEPTYKDTGLGGLMLTVAEIEKLRKKQEEYKTCQLVAEQIVKEFEDDWVGRLNEKVNGLEKRLTGFEDDLKGIVELYEERKMKITGDEVVDDEGGEKENEKEHAVNQESEEKIKWIKELKKMK